MADFIENYLKRFKVSLDEGDIEKDKIIEIVGKITRAEIKRSDIEVRDGVLFLKIKPIIKSEIVMKKKELLKEMSPLKIFEIK